MTVIPRDPRDPVRPPVGGNPSKPNPGVDIPPPRGGPIGSLPGAQPGNPSKPNAGPEAPPPVVRPPVTPNRGVAAGNAEARPAVEYTRAGVMSFSPRVRPAYDGGDGGGDEVPAPAPAPAPAPSTGASGSANDPINLEEWLSRAGPWTEVQYLSPEQQWLYEQQLRNQAWMGSAAENMLQQVSGTYSQPANFAGELPSFNEVSSPFYRGLGGEIQYAGGPFDRSAAEQAYYNREMRFLEPRMRQEEQRLHERLMSQGFNVQDPAYQDQMRRLYELQGQQRADAIDRAILGGGQEATGELQRILSARGAAQGERQAEFQAGMERAQLAQSEEQRRLSQALARIGVLSQDRARALNELNALIRGGQLAGMGGGGTGQASIPGMGGLDVLGAMQQDFMNRLGVHNANEARRSQTGSAIGTAAGAAIGGMAFGNPWLGMAIGGALGGLF